MRARAVVRRSTKIAVASCFALVLIGLAACGPATGGTAKAVPDFKFGTVKALPESFPDGFPVLAGRVVQEALPGGGGGTENGVRMSTTTTVIQTEYTPQQVWDFYHSDAPAKLGWAQLLSDKLTMGGLNPEGTSSTTLDKGNSNVLITMKPLGAGSELIYGFTTVYK